MNCFQVPHSRLPHHSRYSPLRLSCFLFIQFLLLMVLL
nr:MAG TPA: hypothetical protein [Caudoviricetes sp.]